MDALKGEMIRHRRICSDETFAQMNDKCLEQEYEKLGYAEKNIVKIKNKELAGYKKQVRREFQDKSGKRNSQNSSVWNKNRV